MTSNDTLDPRIQRNVQVMLADPKLKGDVTTYLQEIEGVDPAQYMGGGNSLARGAGLVARGDVQGLGNLVGFPYAMAGLAYNKLTGNQPPGILQPQGGAAADQLGLPQPQSGGERMVVAGAEGSAAAAPFGAAGAMAPMVSQGLGVASSMAGQGAQEAGASPMGQMAASAAVGLGLPVVGAMGASVIRSALAGSATRREAARQSMALLQAGNPQGPVSLGQVAEGGVGRMVEGGLKNVPGASQTLQNTSGAQGEALGAKATRIADQVSPGGTPTSAGVAIQRGISEGFVPQFRATSKALYDKVYQLVPGETPVIPSKTVGLFADQGNLAAQARPLSDELFANGKMGKWSESMAATLEASPQGIPFNVLKEWRSQIGEALSGADMIEGVGMRDLKRLYGTLSDDMRTAVASRGPAAERAWDRAQQHWKAGTDRLEGVLQPLMDKRSPELAFNAAMAGTKDGATLLRSTMRSLAPVEKRLVASTVLRKLGHNPGTDTFTPETYLRNWNKLSPEAKGTLFEGIDQNIPKDLNRLAQAAAIRGEAGKVLFNPSGTAVNTAFLSILTGSGLIGAGAVSGNTAMMFAGSAPLAGVAAANLTARAFTNPNVIRWLVKQTAVPAGALKQQLAILAKDSQKWDPESRDIADEMVSTLGNIDWPKMIMATALADQAH